MTTIQALGRIGVYHEGKFKPFPPSPTGVIALLVAAGPNGLSDEKLADALWGDELPGSWQTSIRRPFPELRRALPLGAIPSGTRHYVFELPAREIDIWQLLSHHDFDLNDPTQIADDHLRSLLIDEPYPGAHNSDLVRNSVADIEAARIELLDRIVSEAPHRATGRLVAAARRLTRETWNENMIRAVVELCTAGGETGTARRLLDEAIDRLQGEFDAVGPGLFELQQALSLRSPLVAVDKPPSDPILAPAKWIGHQPWKQAINLIDRPATIAQAISHLDADRGVLLTGESGAGKTEVARQLAESRHRDGHGNHIVWLVAQRGSPAAFAPIVGVFGDLVNQLAATTDTHATDDDLIDIKRWAMIQKHIRARCPHRRLTFIVDDAQWLDSQSAQLIEFWARSSAIDDVEMIIIGRPDDQSRVGASDRSAEWRESATRLKRSGVVSINIEPFSRDELVDLIGLYHPAASSHQRNHLADYLTTTRAVLPAVAAELIASADPVTLTLGRRSETNHEWDDLVWTSLVEPPVATVAGTAALLGLHFSFGDVVKFSDLDDIEVGNAIDELIDLDLVIDGDRPDRLSFRHVLVQDAFARTVPAPTTRAFHQRAAAIAHGQGQQHARARHLIAATPVVDIDELGQALLDSAHAHARSRSFLEAVHAFEAADTAAPSAMTAEALADYAHAIERSGGDASQVRERAIDAAHLADDPELMLHVLAGGADPGEMLESEPNRMKLLDRIPRERLSPADQLRLDVTRCRELSVAGHLDQAREVYDAMTLNSPDDHATAWLALWGFFVGSPPTTWPKLGVAPDAITDDVNRARVRNVECARLLLMGNRDGFDRDLEALGAEPASIENPARQWHVHLLRSMRTLLEGKQTDATEMSNAALNIGRQYGIAGAFAAYTAQFFADHWLRGRHGDLVPLLDSAAPDVSDSLLASAARASALLTLDDRIDDGVSAAIKIIDQLETQAYLAHPAIAALLAEDARHLPHHARDQLAHILRPFAGNAVLVSAGIAHLGPAHRALSFVADEHSQAVDLLRLAIVEADTWQLPVWSVRCRLDLALLTDEDKHFNKARDMANELGGELMTMFFD